MPDDGNGMTVASYNSALQPYLSLVIPHASGRASLLALSPSIN